MMTAATKAMFSPYSPIAGSRAGPGRDSGWRAAPDEGRTSKARALIRLALTALCLLILTGTAFAQNTALAVPAGGTGDLSIEIASHWGGPILAADIQGDYAYIANGRMFRILDISDETNPVEVGALALQTDPNAPSRMYDVKVRGGYAFVAREGEHFFNVVDVSDPAAPSLVRSIGDSTYKIAAQIELYENRAYVLETDGHWGDRIRIYRIDDPANPVSSGSLSTISLLTSIAIDNGHLFVGLFGAEDIVRVYDLSNPSIPAPIGSLAVPGFSQIPYLLVAGDHLYVAARITPGEGSGYGLLTVDISDPTAPFLTDEQVGFSFANLRPLAVSDGRLYAFDRLLAPGSKTWANYRGLYVFDISQTPEAPVLLDTYRPEYGPFGMILSAAPGRVYLYDKAEGLVIMDVADPSLPQPLGKFHSPSELRKMVADGSKLYISDVWGGFTVLDVADNSRPRVLGSYLAKRHDDIGINVYGIDKVDDIVYLAGSSGLLTVDVSDPARPHTLGAMRISSMAFPSSPWCGAAFQGLKVRDQVAYLGYLAHFCLSAGTYLLAVDVSDPFAPIAIGVAGLFGGIASPVHSLALGDGIVADNRRASIHGITNPTDPQWLHGPIFPLHPVNQGYASDVAIHESLRLFTALPPWASRPFPAGVIDGLNIQDIGDPTSPVTISSVSLGESIYALSVQHDSHRIYLRSQQSVLAVDISDPVTPVELHRLTAFQVDTGRYTFDPLVGLLADEPRLYATDWLGLTVLNVHDVAPNSAAARARQQN